MMSHAFFSRFHSISTGLAVVCASLVFSGSTAKAQSEATGDNWQVGASAGDNSSIGIAATVDVPAPTNSATPVVNHSTNEVSQPAQVPAAQAPSPAAAAA